MGVEAKKSGAWAYTAGACFFGSFAMFWQLGKDMAAAGQIRLVVYLILALVGLIFTIKSRDKWTVENIIQEEKLKFVQKLAGIENELSLVKKECEELLFEKQLLLADIEDAHVRNEQSSIDEFQHQVATSDRDHVSNNLAILNQAAAKFWANADRDDRTTHPSKADVVAWLIARGFSDVTAKSGATIIRPEWAPTGRKAEE